MQHILDSAVDAISTVVLGKREQIRLALTCFLARGHLLIEDLPGIGKTTLAQSLARVFGLEFSRIQFTADLLPGDILGVSVYEQNAGLFTFHPGPVFTQVLLADEINRATPKTQSALLEAMEEGQITVEGQTRSLKSPFFVIATQNPLEQAGTFALPESQKDRFLFRLAMGYPDAQAEQTLLRQDAATTRPMHLEPVIDAATLLHLQHRVDEVHVSDILISYIRSILEASRTSDRFLAGLSPRAGLALLRGAKAWAFVQGREYVMPEDIQDVFPFVAIHRLSPASGQGAVGVEEVSELLDSVPVPL
ncbi:AAA family ATPase [Desulfoplanes formicivorans]|uniref:ATPase AAA n=1 Tax=Desulfoplanes formicivorans TaxID=1592317 RepID=A0A194AGJ2_9BACT|nr:MoxR family ATPase [Desulfoplanes formicivorans]GAU08201.1 ATPase AAA [Desulfoplanes formicivorans]